MRRRLVVAVVIGSMLFLQAPVEAASHLYLKMRRSGSTTEVRTNCPAGYMLKVTKGTASRTITVPSNATTTSDGLKRFYSSALNTVANATGTLKGTCSPALQGHTNMTVLPFTGVTTGRQLMVGGGLLAVGIVLLLFGFSPPSSRGPRGPRPPVKVYAQ